MLKISMHEACKRSDRGSIGAFYIRHWAEKAGYPVDVQPHGGQYDVELVSLHHCTDFPRLAEMPKRAKWRIVGGHPTFHNPRPAIPFADAICVGEGESWIGPALRRLDDRRTIDALRDMPGTIVCHDWQPGSELPEPLVEDPLPDNPPYHNRPGTRSEAWYVEIARGCPYKCAYCGLGHAVKHRRYSRKHLEKKIDSLDYSKARKVNFYAPDEASHPDYQVLYQRLKRKGYAAAFSSMRVDSILRKPPEIPMNMLVRVGVDGLTEKTRRRVGKQITNKQIMDYFRMFLDKGHVQFKMFMIIGYPWEKPSDFDEFEQFTADLFRLPLEKNVSLRVKWTPLIPQPKTPLCDVEPQYDFEMVRRIHTWHGIHRYPRTEPGFWVTNDGLMTRKSHQYQIKLTRGDERVCLGNKKAKPLNRRFT